jgi:hypothetical protein
MASRPALHLHGRAPDDRAAELDRYGAALAPGQDALAREIERLGGRIVNRRSLTAHVAVQMPAARVGELASWPGVLGIARTAPLTRQGYTGPLGGYTGADIRAAMRLSYPIASGYNGGGASIGLIDCDPIPPQHWNMRAGT